MLCHMELLGRRARRREIQRLYLHGAGYHNHLFHLDSAGKNDMDCSSGRGAYTVRTLHFRAETESEMERETGLKKMPYRYPFLFRPTFATYK